ncbi:MAG TPA: hypothetical protein VGO17_12280, partial [Aurantimonas sp.]|nr:hypothetical protein [Aurantimonas sp.]
MTALPVQIDSHAQPSARRTAGRTEQKDGSDFTSALGARDEKRTAAKADAEPAAEGISPKGAAGNDEGGPATVEALTAGDPAGQGAAASAEGVPQGLAAILAAVEAGRRGAGSETKAAREPADGKPVGAAIADHAGRAGGGPADMPADPASQKNIFARMPGPATDDARSEIFRRLEATAASIVDADGASLRVAASGQGSPDGRIRADFVSMRTHFAPAGHGTGVPGTGAPGGGAPAFRAVAPGRSFAGPDAPMVPDGEPEAGAAFAAGADEASQPSGKAGSALPDNAREAGPTAARPDGRAEARRGADDKDGTAVRLPAAKTETGAASPQGIGFANAPSTGAIPDVPLGRQVASALGGAVSDLRSDLSGSEAEGNLRLRAGGAALKTIQIQLQPAHFGKLDVTMK